MFNRKICTCTVWRYMSSSLREALYFSLTAFFILKLLQHKKAFWAPIRCLGYGNQNQGCWEIYRILYDLFHPSGSQLKSINIIFTLHCFQYGRTISTNFLKLFSETIVKKYISLIKLHILWGYIWISQWRVPDLTLKPCMNECFRSSIFTQNIWTWYFCYKCNWCTFCEAFDQYDRV